MQRQEFSGTVAGTNSGQLGEALGHAAFSDPTIPSLDVPVELVPTGAPDISPVGYEPPRHFMFHPTNTQRHLGTTSVHGYATEIQQQANAATRPPRSGWLTLIVSHEPEAVPLFSLTLNDDTAMQPASQPTLPAGV